MTISLPRHADPWDPGEDVMQFSIVEQSWPAAGQVRLPEPDPREYAESDEPAPGSIAGLAGRLDADVQDADDVRDDIAALGVDDEAARHRYGMADADALGGSVLAVLQHRTPPGRRRAPARHAYLTAALVRCALYLGPLSIAVAAARSLREVAWQVPALALLLGWSAAQALTSLGVSMARRGGRPAAARLVGGGFAAAALLWCGCVWVAPAALLGPDRWLAGSVGIGGLAALATVTAALVTRAEAAVIRWSLPCWLLGAISLAATLGDGWATRVPIELLLPAAVTIAVIRAYRPVIGRSLPRRPALSAADLRRGFGYLVIGAAQALSVAMLWRSGSPGATSPAAFPLLAAVPVLEALVCWHTRQVERGLDAAESKRELRRHVRGVTIVTVAGLLPPLAAGAALAVAAYRLPHGLSASAGARDVVLALAAGTLLSGLFAATFLLAARRRTALAAVLASAAPAAVAALPLLPGAMPARLPAIVAVLTATHLIGLLAVALTVADPRRST